MLFDFTGYKFRLRPGYTDMRSGVWSLLARIEENGDDPYEKTIYMCCSRDRKTIKAFVYDDGFWLLQKKIANSTFKWPESEEECANVTAEDVRRLLSGQDVFRRVGLKNLKLIY